MSESTNGSSPTPPGAPQSSAVRRSGRCHECGYSLVGLGATGNCPECGTPFTEESASRLKPWPSAFSICLRLGWPIATLLTAGIMISAGNAGRSGGDANLTVLGFLLGWGSIVAIAINSYFQVRSMLKRSLPNRVRTRGPVAALRAIGTTVCVLIMLGFVGLPLAFGVGCLIILSQGGF